MTFCGGGGVPEVSMPHHVASEEAVFNLSSAIFFISTSKKFVCLFRTLNGLLYEVCVCVCMWAKSRTKTRAQVCKSFGTYVGLWHCTGKLYVKFANINVSWSIKEIMSQSFCGGHRKTVQGAWVWYHKPSQKINILSHLSLPCGAPEILKVDVPANFTDSSYPSELT